MTAANRWILALSWSVAACSNGGGKGLEANPAGSADAGPSVSGTSTDPGGAGGAAGPTRNGGTWTPTVAGALVRVSMTSSVGVLLDEIPATIRDRVAGAILARPLSFWTARAERQIALTMYHLTFRQAFYPDKLQLPMPPRRLWDVRLRGVPARVQIGAHDVVAIGYAVTSTILTDAASPGISEPMLASVGGRWLEPFSFPIDPELIVQRTGYACMDEAEFPPHSVDGERAEIYYDDACQVEQVATSSGCHQSRLPQRSCHEALDASVGRVDTALAFERLPWDAALADRVRVGPVTNPTGADLQPVTQTASHARVLYRYFEPDDCSLVERCVGAPGWRRLLAFSTVDANFGARTLDIGPIDYFNDANMPTPLVTHGVFEFSPCHHHYHFMHYGTFSFGDGEGTTSKRGFCLQSIWRESNNEASPLHNPYGDCRYQGIAAGWSDEYNDGLPCQWIDVTSVDTSAGPVTRALKTTANPDGFLCEGTPVRDSSGALVFEPTSFKTAGGQPVDRPKCDFFPGWADNDADAYDVTVPAMGEGFVTAPCAHGQIGPLRDCGLTKLADGLTCTPGQTVQRRCTLPAGAAPQVVRVCEASAALGVGLACTYDAGLESAVVDGAATISFVCPGARGAGEPGGRYALFGGPAFPDDAPAGVTCVTAP